MAIKKVINSQSQTFQPILTDTLVLDAVPTVNSFNSVTSDAVARAVAGASGEVPQVTENDNGKILTAIYDAGGPAVEWAEAPDPLPTIGDGDNGKVLMASVSESGGSTVKTASWQTPPSGVSTASGHFDLGGSVPVKVNYTGSRPVLVDIPVNNTTTSLVSFYFEIQLHNPALYIPSNITQPGSRNTIPYTYYDADDNVLGSFDLSDAVGDDGMDLYYKAGTYMLELPASGTPTRVDFTVSVSSAESTESWELRNLGDNETTIPVVDQSYSASSTNAQSGVAVAGALATVNQVPAVTSADNNKVLTATWNSSTSTGSFAWATAGGGGGSASIGDIVRDLNASNVQGGQTDTAFFNGLVSDIQAGKIVRLVASQLYGDAYVDYAFLDKYVLDGNDSSFYFYSHRYNYLMTWDDGWSVSRQSNT